MDAEMLWVCDRSEGRGVNSKLSLKDVITIVLFASAIVAAGSSYGASMNRLDALDRKVEGYTRTQNAIKWAVIKLCQKQGIDTKDIERLDQ